MSVKIVGWDFNAVFAVGDAMGIDRVVMAEFLPDLETIAINRMNEQGAAVDA
ncbi:DUF7697 family protein [Albibacillus kandeliae]|uniref:DUF7697 family protein n=1 Tax=Albibacillus kandeliae TaxID=2174228 RepID=UPI00130087A4|nr:hypothetical protein [Albibacillus kandeliae]